MPAMSRTPKTRASAPPKPSTLCFNNLSEASTFSEGNHIALQKESLSLVFLPYVTAFTKTTSFKHYRAVQFSPIKALSIIESWYFHSFYSNCQNIGPRPKHRHIATSPTLDRYHLIENDMQSKKMIISIMMIIVYKVNITS